MKEKALFKSKSYTSKKKHNVYCFQALGVGSPEIKRKKHISYEKILIAFITIIIINHTGNPFSWVNLRAL